MTIDEEHVRYHPFDNEVLPAEFEVLFAGHVENRKITIERSIVDMRGELLYLVDEEDVYYNWHSIVKLKRTSPFPGDEK